MHEEKPQELLAGIVLAAGASRRFGSTKQVARYGGETLVERAVRAALGVCPAGVMVVTGAAAAEVEQVLAALPIALCRNDGWTSGLSGSLICGLDQLPAAASAALIHLCDQPLVSAKDLDRLVTAWIACPATPAAAFYGGRPGVPAIFPRSCWPGLRQLTGDSGAAALLRRPGERVSLVDMPAAAADVDDPAALQALGKDGTPR